MKQIFGFLLAILSVMAILMCVAFGGCDSTDTKSGETAREVVSINEVVSSLDNLARAQQYVDKATHLFGTVELIDTDHFILKHIFLEKSFEIPMSQSALAELNKDEFVAVYAVINEIDSDDLSFTDCEKASLGLMDEYVKEYVSNASITDMRKNREYFRVIQYVNSRGDTFEIKNDGEISSFILGQWDASSITSFKAEFLSNGQYLELHTGSYSNTLVEYEWSVENGELSIQQIDSVSYPRSDVNPVYKISDNVMIAQNNTFYMRID